MNALLAALITFTANPAANFVVWLVLASLVIWVVFYVLPLPGPVRTILAVAVALLLVLQFFGCAAYQATVASRTDSLAGYTKDGRSGGVQVSHTVTYR